jgi:hypothetical protein
MYSEVDDEWSNNLGQKNFISSIVFFTHFGT